MIVAVMTTALVGTAWADDATSTLTFNAKCNGSGTADDGAAWTVTSDGTESNFDNTKGIHYGTNSAQVQYIQLSTSDISGTITKVVVNASAASGVSASVSVNVGGSAFGGDAQSVTTSAVNYTFEGSASGEIVVKLEKPSKAAKALYVKSIAVTYTTGGGDTPLLDDCDLALTGAPVALNFDLYNNSSAQVINYTTSSTGAITIADNDYATFDIDEENKTITVTPTAVTPSEQTITVSQAADESYKAGSATFTVTITDSTPIPTHTATFSVNGVTSTQDFEEGAAITFPDDPADVSGKTFVGWVTEAIEGTADEAPEFVTSANMGQSDVTYYAVFAYANVSGSAEVVDVLTTATFGSPSSYSDWSGKQAENGSDAVYAGQSTTNSGNIQLRATSPSGIITTTSGGKAKKVSVTWASNTTSGRILEIFGSNTAYPSASQLYNAATWGNKLGEITYGTSTELAIADAYEYIGIKSKTGALYLSNINITWSTGGGVTYSDYCTTVVAATVERPVIEVAEEFSFSTTAVITCPTADATIYYSFDNENWTEYTAPFTITATTTIYAKAVKGDNESAVASATATKVLVEPVVTIDATGITNTNVYEGTEAGSLVASVTYNDAAVEGATVTWSGNNDEVATIDENGAVTLVAAGTVTFTATYAGNEDYAEKTATYEMTVTNSDPNAPGTENNPYTVAQAIDATPASGTSTNVYIHGFVSAFYGDDIVSDGSNYRYYVSDDGTTDNQLLVYKGKGLNNVAFSSADDLQIGDEVVILGGLTLYKSTPEVAAGNYIVSLSRVEKPAAPTFSVAEGTYTEAQSVELSTTTEGATIYYTIDGTEPTAESTEYTEAIVVTETTTIKAIAVKDDVASDVATATYTINISTTPSISIAEATIEAPATETFGDVAITYENLTISGEGDFGVQFYDGEGEETEAPDWVLVEVAKDNGDYVVSYMIDANDGEARTAYFKVYAMDGEELVYSNLVTVSQAAYVAPATVDQYALFTGNLVEGDYIIYYDGYAMNTDVENGRLMYAEVTPENDVIATDNAAIVWHIAKSGDYWTIYNAEADAYAASTGAKNKAQMLADGTDDMALWSVSGTDEYEFVNKKNSEANVNAYLRNNGTYGFACYAASTGGALSLYKKVGDTPVPTSQTVTVSAAGYATLVAAHDLEIPSGVEVYAVEIRGEWAHLEPVTAGVPAGEAVVVKAEAGEYVFNYAAETVNALTVTNDLVAATAPVTVDGSQYILAKPANQEIGFYKATTGFIAPGKAYLQIAGEAPVKGFTFKFDDDATAIDEIVNGKLSNGKCYNLAGQRVSKMQRGINIVNGKKILK